MAACEQYSGDEDLPTVRSLDGFNARPMPSLRVATKKILVSRIRRATIQQISIRSRIYAAEMDPTELRQDHDWLEE